MKRYHKHLLAGLFIVMGMSVGRGEPVTTTPLVIFSGHTLFVSSVVFSPDGTKVLTGSGDWTAKLWDAATGSEIRTFSGHTAYLPTVAFSPDGTKVLTGSQDMTAKLWDAATGSEIRTFSGHASYVNSVAFSPDGTKVLTGSEDATAKLWNAATGSLLRTFSGPTSVVLSVAYSPDGTKALTGSLDRTANLWNTSTGTLLRTFSGHTGCVYSVAFSPDGTKVLTGSADWTAKLWDASNGSLLRTFSGHTGDIRSVAFSPDGTEVLTGSWDDTAKLWNASNGLLLRTFSGHAGDVNSVAFSPDGAKVLTGSDDATAWLWLAQPSSPPRLQAATLADLDANGVDPGDQLVLTLDRSVVVTTSVLQASHFFLAVQGDSLGGAGFQVGVNPYNSRQIVLTLGAGVHLTAAGGFSMANRTPNSPSGIDFATSIPFGAIRSLDGISAIDGGAPGADDSGIDMELSMVGRSGTVGPSGGTVAVVPSADATYTRHELDVPAGALGAPMQFTLRPPERNLGVINAVQIESSNPAATFSAPARIWVEYREGDIDRERGQLEWEMKVHQLVERPLGVFRYVQVPGPQIVSPAPWPTGTQHSPLIAHRSSVNTAHSELASTGGRVSVGITNLNPCGSLGGTTVFAGLPIETVDERTINIKSGGSPSPVKAQGGAVLDVGTSGAYTLHRIEFPNFVTTNGADPQRLVVRIRTAEMAERESLWGGCSFPSQSGAVFTVTVNDASSHTVQFTSPVNLTVQFKSRPDSTQTDVVHFEGQVADPQEMRLVCDRFAGQAVDFAFTTAPLQTANVSQGTLAVNNFVGLTGSDGRGTFGTVASEFSTRAARWRLYR